MKEQEESNTGCRVKTVPRMVVIALQNVSLGLVKEHF